MSRRVAVLCCVLGIVVGVAGCNRQDTECLSRLGNKLLDHTQTATQEIRAKLDLEAARAPDIRAPETRLRERVLQRLQNDKSLAEAVLDVSASGTEIELKGTVKTPEQRQRAFELAETTVGVEKLTDQLKVEP